MRLTPTQKKMLQLLSDGMPHSRAEVHACLPDELGARTNIYPHLSGIRRQLKEIGEAILVEFIRGRLHFRHVRLLASAYNGYK